MIKIITGDINSGKSTKFLELYNQLDGQLGLYSKKIVEQSIGNVVGYNLVLLPSGEEFPFIRLKEEIGDASRNDFLYQGRFAFSKEVFNIATDYVLRNLTTQPVWIDEIGRLEIRGLGFYSLLKSLILDKREMIITLRSNLLRQFADKYAITNYQLL